MAKMDYRFGKMHPILISQIQNQFAFCDFASAKLNICLQDDQ